MRTRLGLLVGFACWTSFASPVLAQDLAASLEAQVAFEDYAGRPLQRVEAGQGFIVSLAIKDVVTNKAYLRADELQAWIRPVEKTNASCLQAARNFRAAEGRLPRGAVDLNSMLLANLTRENNLHVLSPKLDLAQANILSSNILPERPAALLQQSQSRALYYSLPRAGKVMRLRAYESQPTVFAQQLAQPSFIASGPHGGLWVSHAQGRVTYFDANGTAGDSFDLSGKQLGLQSLGGIVLVHSNKERKIAWLSASNRLERVENIAGGSTDSVLHVDGKSDYLLSIGASGAELELRYLDSLATPVTIKISARATRLALSMDGKWAFAFDPDGKAVSIVDVSAAKLVTALAFKTSVSEVAVTADMAFMRLADNSGIAGVQLNSLAVGKEASVGLSDFGVVAGQAVEGERLLLSLGPSGYLIAVQSGSEAGFVVNGKMQLSRSLPQTGIRFKGGTPFRIEVLQNGFRASDNGYLKAAAHLASPGDYELVFTTGLQGLSSCHKFRVEGTEAAGKPVEVGLVSLDDGRAIAAGQNVTMRFQLQTGNMAQVDFDFRGLRIMQLQSGWRRNLRVPIENGIVTVQTELPSVGTYVVQMLGLPPGHVDRMPVQFEVTQ